MQFRACCRALPTANDLTVACALRLLLDSRSPAAALPSVCPALPRLDGWQARGAAVQGPKLRGPASPERRSPVQIELQPQSASPSRDPPGAPRVPTGLLSLSPNSQHAAILDQHAADLATSMGGLTAASLQVHHPLTLTLVFAWMPCTAPSRMFTAMQVLLLLWCLTACAGCSWPAEILILRAPGLHCHPFWVAGPGSMSRFNSHACLMDAPSPRSCLLHTFQLALPPPHWRLHGHMGQAPVSSLCKLTGMPMQALGRSTAPTLRHNDLQASRAAWRGLRPRAQLVDAQVCCQLRIFTS